MEIAKVKISAADACTVACGTITKGMTGAQVAIEYTDPLWDGLSKTVVFRYGKKILDVVDAGELVTIPAEMTAEVGDYLRIGVYGINATGSLVIPTVYTSLGTVEDAADPSGDKSTDPTLAVWARIQTKIGSLDDLNTEAKDTLVAAINESLTKGGGAVDEAAVQKMVEDYLAANPPADGKDGADGVSCTHSWDGTTLTITSASGTSSADLKGDKGDTGAAGADGADGKDGYTPVKGTDYYTETDKTEMVNLVLAAMPTWEGGSY